jgi:acetolactate synthase regulatory subunit
VKVTVTIAVTMSFFLAYGTEKVIHAIEGKRHHTGITGDDPTCLEDLYTRLKRNELTELKLGWQASDFINTRRCNTLLERALRANTSITSISIGWRHRDRDVFLQVLNMIARHCSKLVSLQLVLDGWVPENILSNLLLQLADLRTIDIRAVKVMRVNDEGKMCCNAYWRHPSPSCDHSIVSRIIVRCLHQHEHLKTLKLIDCDIDDHAANLLADFLHIRGGIANLSLRSNRTLCERGLAVICQAPIIESLDLSLCDLNGKGARAIARSIAARPWVLGELLLCGNYQIDTQGMLELTSQACCDKLLALDISHCDYTDSKAVETIMSLKKLDRSTKLQQITMQGTRVASDGASHALCKLLQSDNSLRVIRMNDRGDPKIMSAKQLRAVLAGVKNNYELERLELDSHATAEDMAVWREMELYLRLNRAGRRILRSKAKAARRNNPWRAREMEVDWFDVVAKAGDDMDVLYWIVRESADRF